MNGLVSLRLAMAALAVLAVPPPAMAVELSGILIHAADRAGNVAGPIWHTSMDRSGRLLGMTRYPPPLLRSIPLGNEPDTAQVVKPLYAGAHVTTLFWQYLPGELRDAMVLNVYLNGNTVDPAISALVPFTYGLTRFVPNPASSTVALDGRATDRTAGTEFADATHRVRLGAAFYMPSSGETSQWRPSDFVDLDRIGLDRLEPDGSPDGILVFELVVEPASRPATTPRVHGPAGNSPAVAVPPGVSIGPDQWTPPARSTVATTPPPTARTAPPTAPAATTTTADWTPQTPTPATSRSPGLASTPSRSPETSPRPETPTAGRPSPATTRTQPMTTTRTAARTASPATLTVAENQPAPPVLPPPGAPPTAKARSFTEGKAPLDTRPARRGPLLGANGVQALRNLKSVRAE
ncbi:hypothetical protein L6Q96_17920 [Candidatus Binatia bacterium]|nr:hypothetical protein [Candidatus Binatia bacterium]